ncbi:hydroxyisourate hydrolase [Flavobacterium sedimenticola]|uniref:5-hydroxyisourate hydrolase n=1 Tax=Flavobacterium sedimenticola TaxID=3043286 RepID=A0ABT6XTG3_9FLAO|nr:hydroxyisourate hydrolase [Flavobacterium sedimenticola]MDI9258383.1 hydroxyisourate hydrolase [Flavobacterium sedimenticola]
MKKIIFALLFCSSFAFAQEKFQLSTHILDISKGIGASYVEVELRKQDSTNQNWLFLDKKMTDNNGRIKELLPMNKSNVGIYKLIFKTQSYFVKQQQESFYPFIEVVFEIKDNEHYHVPITLSANGYSTYRGN